MVMVVVVAVAVAGAVAVAVGCAVQPALMTAVTQGSICAAAVSFVTAAIVITIGNEGVQVEAAGKARAAVCSKEAAVALVALATHSCVTPTRM